jgi:hypothetical protein
MFCSKKDQMKNGGQRKKLEPKITG